MTITKHESRTLSHESGRSMIEMLGVLLVMGVITVAAVQMIGAAMRSQQRTTVQDDVAKMVTGVRQLLGDFDDFSNINNNIFAAIGVNNRNPLGGVYELSVNPSDRRQFVVAITGLNTNDCEFFRTRAWSDSVGFRQSNGRQSGATATPANCGDQSGRNVVRITFAG